MGTYGFCRGAHPDLTEIKKKTLGRAGGKRALTRRRNTACAVGIDDGGKTHMQRKMLKILMALCLVLCLAPAALAEPTTVVTINVGGVG